jgi:hypothetical protein
VSGPTASQAGPEAWRDTLRPAAERVADLLARMTLEEKVAQLTSAWPGVQEDLLRVMVVSGTPVVLVLVTGRPYAIGPVAGELAGMVQTYFPGEEGGGAIAGRTAVLLPAPAAGRAAPR